MQIRRRISGMNLYSRLHRKCTEIGLNTISMSKTYQPNNSGPGLPLIKDWGMTKYDCNANIELALFIVLQYLHIYVVHSACNRLIQNSSISNCPYICLKYKLYQVQYVTYIFGIWYIKQQQYHVKSSDNLVFRHHDLPTQLLKIYFEKMCNVLMNGNFVNVKKSFPGVVGHKPVVMVNKVLEFF